MKSVSRAEEKIETPNLVLYEGQNVVRLWVLAPRLPGCPSFCQVSKPGIPPHHKGWKVPQSYTLLLLCCPVRTLLDATSRQ